MSYYMDDTGISLNAVEERIRETDLVPSREALLDSISEKFRTLEGQGIATLANLRSKLKNKKNIASLATATGIDADYLTLLRREIESWFPKASPLSSFDWFPEKEIEKLTDAGLKTAPKLYDATVIPADRKNLLDTTGIDSEVLNELLLVCGLTRVQWMSPTAARMVYTAGYTTHEAMAAADPEELCMKLEEVNEGGRFFKGKIGLRDVRRLVKAAGYIE